MPLPWFEEEVRRVQDEPEPPDAPDYDDFEDFTSSVNDVWEELTTLPVVLTIMNTAFTFDSTGMPPWLSTQDPPDALQGTDGQLSVPQTQTAPGATSIALTAITVPVPASAEGITGASSGPSITGGAPASTSVSASGTNSASPSKSTSCTTPSGSDAYSDGAALHTTWTGGGGGWGDNNGGVTDPPGPNNGDSPSDGGGPPLGLILAAVIIPVLVISLLAFTIFVVLRRRRQRKAAGYATASEEMKLRLSDDFPPREPPPGPGPSPGPGPGHEPPPQAPPRVMTPASPPPPPVIVSAMNPASNSSYFTGIDTSEALSVRTNSVRSGPRTAGFMMDGEFHEEPPPPYRPRSVPPISRDSSMRTANRGDFASSHLMGEESRSANPFADPSDDEDDSIRSGGRPYSGRTGDQLSVVSDLSYQNEPAIIHQAV